MSGFLLPEAMREGIRGVRVRRAGSALLIVLSALLGSGTVFWSWLETSSAHSVWLAAHYAGADSFSVRATSEYPIASGECERLRSVEGVENAGGVLGVSDLYPEQAPDTPIRLVTASPGLLALAYPADQFRGASVVLGSALAAELGLVEGGSLSFTDAQGTQRTVTNVGLARQSSMLAGLGSAVLIADSSAIPVGECIVTAVPGARDSVGLVLQDWFTQPGIKVVDYLSQDDLRRDPVRELQERPSAIGPIVSGALLIVLALVATWARRSESALYRMLGLSWRGLLALRSTEAAALVCVPAAMGVVIALLILQREMPDAVVQALIRDSSILLLLLLPLPILLALVSVAQSPVDVAKGA